ncbi:MAG: LodA/GoxA family CTQ-dependent oxidase [Acetobacteraceae bacterium]
MSAHPVSFKIQPPIGVARVGNSPTEFLVGPNGSPPPAYKDSGDTDNLFLPRIKRQGALFRIFAYDASGLCLGEIAQGTVRSIEWTVCLANRKAAGRRIGARQGDDRGKAKPGYRNKQVQPKDRWKLEITPQPRQLSEPNRRAVFDDGRFMDIAVCLGEIRTDAESRLIVLGGYGKAGTHDAGKRIRSCTDNDGWYDDVSDGPVSATITLLDGKVIGAAPSWVIVTPPDFAPGLSDAATLYGSLTDHPVRPDDAFRLDHDKLLAGAITQSMACPWQADLLEASAPSSPCLRPDVVLTEETLETVRRLDERIAALPADTADDEQGRLLRERRDAAWMTRLPWARGLPTDSPAREESLVKEWSHLGFVVDRGTQGAPCFVETERSPWLGTMADYFHRLVNIEANRDFTPKALELALGMLEDAKFSADRKFVPFRYSPKTLDKNLDAIYADFVDTVMYKPVPWESGDITWNAILDYDEDDEPVRRERLFRVGRFSDRALAERFRQFGPLNLTDGAWLQNILPAGPVDEVRARLFAIWLDEAGNGRPELNHSNVYDTLLRSLNIYMPPVTSRDFVEQDLVRSAFESSVFQLCVGLFPHRFLPELLGMTLFVEWEATPTMDPISRMMTARHIDPQYYRMHAAIDNINAGHGALAKDAIKMYLHVKEQEGGDGIVQEHWQRIWRGYVAWSTLGNGADEVLERMLIVDKKQIHLRSSLLLASDILPPLIAALRSAQDPVSTYLRGRLSPPTAVLLGAAWTGEAPSADLLDGLRLDLNACLRAGLHDEARFASVPLSAPTRALLRLAPRHGVDLIDLGRSLLEDAYPDGIAPRVGFPDIKGHYAARMAALIRGKTQLALQSHRRKGWLIDAFKGGPEEVMRMLLRRGLIDIHHPAHSPFFEKLEFSGPMYKVFTEEEKAVIIDWIESLRADGAAVARPQPRAIVVTDPVQPLVSASVNDDEITAPPVPKRRRSYGEKRARIGMGSVH